MTTHSTPLTPMLRQYHELKQQHPGTILFFRLGDFYELFYDDAVTGAREMEITLTARHKERGTPVPMCGVPHHAVAGYVARLIRKGYRVAICEQTEDPSKAKKLVRREVVRVVTPGTAVDPQLVEAKETVYLAAVCGAGDTFGAAFLDLSTGEFHATETSGPEAWERLRSEVEGFAPREILFPRSLTQLVRDAYTGRGSQTSPLPLASGEQSQPSGAVARITPAPQVVYAGVGVALTPLDDWLWEPLMCASLLLEQFGARTLEGYGLAKKTEAVSAAGACLRYARETQRATAAHVTDIDFFETHDHLVLDSVTCRNLELVESQSGAGRACSLLGVIDQTVTGMGARLLRAWLLRPSVRRGEIEARHGAVEELARSQMRRDRVQNHLREVADLERLIGRVNMGTVTPRDLASLRRSLAQVPSIREALSDSSSSLLQVLREGADELSDVRELVASALSDEPPAQLSEGGVIRDGFDTELDELRAISRDAKHTIVEIEARERARSGLASLRVRFNNVFGYFIEVSKANAARVPQDYERRQTLANAERYTTPELKEWERKVLGAEDRIVEIETRLFGDLRARVSRETRRLQATARALATLDALASLAETAVRRRYARPVLHDGDELEIKAGRHPVIESLSEAPFIPNDLYMNNSTDRLHIITGPNMGGKCLKYATLVFTDRGLVEIGSLRPENSRVGSFAELSCLVKNRDGVSTATHFYSGGKQATIKITTRYGFSIEGTPEHRLWIRDAGGNERWVRIGEINQGDTIAIDRQIDLWGQETAAPREPAVSLKGVKKYRLPVQLDDDLGYLIGLLIGDGSLTTRLGFALTTADDFIADEFRRIISKHFGCRVSHNASHLRYEVFSKQVRVFLECLGLGYGRSYEKYVPHAILRAPKHIVRAFLQGLFDTDGWAANKQVKVFLATSSEQLARQVQLLLLNFGIVASLRAKKTPRRPSHQVSIYGSDAIRFHNEVGFRLPRKKARAGLDSGLRMPNVGIPHLAGVLKGVQQRIVATPGKPIALKRDKSINSIFYTYLPSHRNISYGKLGELVAYCRLNDVSCPELETLQRQRYFYDPVVSVEGGEAEVYDLSVAGEHSYVANGFISHNSTILRQTALVSILAQMGSFVPAESARLPVLDRVWTRVGASDDLARGRSTFMVEMTETAAILHNATPRSLVILDEIGRGTATFDGLSIAWAVAEHLHDSPEHAAKTLFATHYHELTELAERLPGAQNYQIRVAEREGEVIFLYKLERGRASKSYGIEVARLAGLPPPVLARAREVLARLERYELDVFAEEADEERAEPAAAGAPEGHGRGALERAALRARRQAIAAQATLFDSTNQALLDELRGVDVETLSAEEARQMLIDLLRRIV